MAGLQEIRKQAEELKVTDLYKLRDSIDQLINETRKKEFVETLLTDDKTVYADVGRGTSQNWQKHLIIGIDEDGVIVRDYNNPDAKKMTKKWNKVRTKSEHELLGK